MQSNKKANSSILLLKNKWIIPLVFEFCDDKTIIKIQRVNKMFFEYARSNQIWEKRLEHSGIIQWRISKYVAQLFTAKLCKNNDIKEMVKRIAMLNYEATVEKINSMHRKTDDRMDKADFYDAIEKTVGHIKKFLLTEEIKKKIMEMEEFYPAEHNAGGGGACYIIFFLIVVIAASYSPSIGVIAAFLLPPLIAYLSYQFAKQQAIEKAELLTSVYSSIDSLFNNINRQPNTLFLGNSTKVENESKGFDKEQINNNRMFSGQSNKSTEEKNILNGINNSVNQTINRRNSF